MKQKSFQLKIVRIKNNVLQKMTRVLVFVLLKITFFHKILTKSDFDVASKNGFGVSMKMFLMEIFRKIETDSEKSFLSLCEIFD